MTAQIPETLSFRGKDHALCNEPLGDYFRIARIETPFASPSTALWRGYRGKWEIVDGRLYLVALHGRLRNGEGATLATLFPDYPQRVFAHWYSGRLRLPEGRLLDYVHGGYDSRYERDVFLTFERGVLVGEETVVNGVAADDAPEGYGIAALTTFARPPAAGAPPPAGAEGDASSARDDDAAGAAR